MSMEAVAVASRPRSWRRTLRACGAWMLVAGCLLLLGAIVFSGARVSTYDELRAGVAAGDVHEVRIDGRTEAHWQTGLVPRVADVPPRAERELLKLDPSLRVTHGELSAYSDLASWRLPSWTGVAGLLVAIYTLVLLVIGPPPWRATRWAWFWLLYLAPPLGLLAFLLLGGSTGRWPPAHPSRRLTGGTAFALAAVLHLVLGLLASVVL